MAVLTWATIGILSALAILWRRRSRTVGFYRHLLVAAVAAVSAGLLYSWVAKIDLNTFDAGRLLLAFVSAVIAVYASVTLAQAARNYRMR